MGKGIKRMVDYLRGQFKAETGISWINSQGEPDIDYVEWLEKRILQHGKSQNLPIFNAEESLALLDKALAEMTPEEKEKFFPKDTTPKGWVSIEEHLPYMRAMDIMDGCTVWKVKNADGLEFFSPVSDHAVWYYFAKESGITHWWNP